MRRGSGQWVQRCIGFGYWADCCSQYSPSGYRSQNLFEFILCLNTAIMGPVLWRNDCAHRQLLYLTVRREYKCPASDNKPYIVIPVNSSEEDLARLDALCLIFGIGLILFDSTKTSDPGFQIRARAFRDDPDMFYVNKNLKEIEDELFT